MTPLTLTRGSYLRPLVVVSVIACAVLACGKKGAPLPPFVRVPAGVQGVTATRLGTDVFVSFTLPTTNVDRSTPIDLGTVEVYAYTGATAPSLATFVPQATRLVTIPVQPPVETTNPGASAARVDNSDGVAVGATVTIVDPDVASTLDMRRFYLVVPFSTRGRPGPQHTPVDVVLAPLPPPPTGLAVTYSATTISVTWTPAVSPPLTALATNVYRAAPAVATAPPWGRARPEPLNREPLAATSFVEPVAFGVERCYVARSVAAPAPPPAAATAPGPSEAGVSPGSPATPSPGPERPLGAPVTPPVATTAAGRGTLAPPTTATAAAGAQPRPTTPPLPAGESVPSARVCVTPIDTFPPSAPVQLVVVAAAGAMNLVWDANAEPDLGGYLVLRGAPGDVVLRPLMSTPIRETRFTDTTVVPGMRYVYAVVAVDQRVPTPNTSAESVRVEEAAQ